MEVENIDKLLDAIRKDEEDIRIMKSELEHMRREYLNDILSGVCEIVQYVDVSP